MDSGVLVLVGMGSVAWWLLHSWAFPWRPCGACKGDPKRRSRGAFTVYCPLCRGSGKRRRWGARLLGRGFGQS